MLIETMLTEESLYPQVLNFLFLPTDCSTKHFQGRIAKKKSELWKPLPTVSFD